MKYFLALIFFASQADAACTNLRMNNLANPTWNFNTNSAPSLAITARRNGTANGCDYFIVISYGTGGSWPNRRITQGGNFIPMQIYKDIAHTQVIKDLPDATLSTEVIIGNFPSGSGATTQALTYYPQMSSTDYNRFGSYTNSFVIKIYEGTLAGPNTLKDTKNVTFNYTMPKQIDLSLVNTGSAFDALDTSQTMNFGTLIFGQSQNFDLKVKYNAGYIVRFSSLRNGNLKHSSLADLVPYSLAANGVPVNLAGSNVTPVTVSTATGVSPVGGLTFNVAATIGTIGTARAGSYSDSITITVATTE